VLCSRDPPTESENEPRVEASLLAAPLKKLFGLVEPWFRESTSRVGRSCGREREVGDLFGGNHLAERGIRGFDGDLVALTSTF